MKRVSAYFFLIFAALSVCAQPQSDDSGAIRDLLRAGDVQFRRGDVRNARATYQRALERARAIQATTLQADTLIRLADLTARFASAAQDLNTAAALSDDAAAIGSPEQITLALNNAAVYLARMGRHADALDRLQRIVAENIPHGDRANHYYNLGRAWERVASIRDGNQRTDAYKSAEANYREAIRLHPDFDEAALGELRSLRGHAGDAALDRTLEWAQRLIDNQRYLAFSRHIFDALTAWNNHPGASGLFRVLVRYYADTGITPYTFQTSELPKLTAATGRSRVLTPLLENVNELMNDEAVIRTVLKGGSNSGTDPSFEALAAHLAQYRLANGADAAAMATYALAAAYSSDPSRYVERAAQIYASRPPVPNHRLFGLNLSKQLNSSKATPSTVSAWSYLTLGESQTVSFLAAASSSCSPVAGAKYKPTVGQAAEFFKKAASTEHELQRTSGGAYLISPKVTFSMAQAYEAAGLCDDALQLYVDTAQRSRALGHSTTHKLAFKEAMSLVDELPKTEQLKWTGTMKSLEGFTGVPGNPDSIELPALPRTSEVPIPDKK